MELSKKKYKAEEVNALLVENSATYAEDISALKERIAELINENKNLSAAVEGYVKKEKLIDSALINAEKTAEAVRKKEEAHYALTVEKLKNFYFRWNSYFKSLYEKYPLYPEVKQAADLTERLREILKSGGDKSVIDKLSTAIPQNPRGKKQSFDPKAKIDEYIAATGDNGFNLEEVLNPGELQLEDICKELGLIEE